MNDDWRRVFAIATQIRDAGATLVASVRAGELTIDDAHSVADTDAFAGRVFAVKVYEAVPGIGKVKARRTMAAIGIAEDASLAAVSAEQRSAITARFIEIEGKPLSSLI